MCKVFQAWYVVNTKKKKKYTWNLKFQMIKEKYQAKECQCSNQDLWLKIA